MAANRVAGARCAVVHDVTTARLARSHNDANLMALGARVVGAQVAVDCLMAFLDTPFEGGRHQRRVAKLG
jgi:ribose 5-phosphate isomerase B